MSQLADLARRLADTVKHIKAFVMHARPDLDCITACWLFLRFGKQAGFEGCADAEIQYWTNGGKPPDGRTAEEWMGEGSFPIDVGQGPLDHHQDPDSKECAATLTAEFLGIRDLPELQQILDYVNQTDHAPDSNKFGLASLVKIWHANHPDESELVIRWTLNALDELLKEQRRFHYTAKAAFKEAKIFTFQAQDRKIKVAVIETDEEAVRRVAFSAAGGYCSVLVQKSSCGVQIFTNRSHNVFLDDVICILRVTELAVQKRSGRPNFKQLCQPGALDAVPEWFYYKEGNMIFNGSLTHPDVPSTRLPMSKIVSAVKLGLSTEHLDPCCPKDRCLRSKCPLHKYGRLKCRRTRYEHLQS